MRPLQTDFSIYSKFDFENQPVGVKFLLNRPEGIEQLGKGMAFCEMIKEAQQRGTPFYMTKENEDCAGKSMLGMEDPSPIGESGQVGIKYGIFQEPRANGRINQEAPKLAKGLCLDNGLGRAPVFLGNTDPAIGAFLRIDGYRLKYEPLTVDLVTCDDSPFGAPIDAETAFETSLGNLVSHINLS